jgi:hypothetical protein
MNKVIVMGALFCALAGCAGSPAPEGTAAVPGAVPQAAPEQLVLPPEKRGSLAILPFTGGTGEEGETVAELFSFEKALTGVFNPMPRTSINRAIREEQRFQMAGGMTDPDTIAALGKQLGARFVLSGSITGLGDRKFLIIGILKIDDLRQIAGDALSYGSIEEVQGKLPGMARNIAAAVVRADAADLPRLALPPVALSGGANRRDADTLAQALAAYLIQGGKYAVYPRTASLEQIQAEYANQLSGDTADEYLPDLGQGTNPDRVLSVTARKLGSRNMFNAAIINMVTGVQEAGETADYGTLGDGLAAMEELAAVLGGNVLNVSDADSFGRALAAAGAGRGGAYVITLRGSFALNPVTLRTGRKIILKGSGGTRVITNNGGDPLFIIPAGAGLTLGSDVTLDGNGKGARTVAIEGGELIMKNGSAVRGSAWGGVIIHEGGRFAMEGGTISGNRVDGGGGGGVAINSGSSFIMSGGTISGNTAILKDGNGGGGGGVRVGTGGSFTMSGGTIGGNAGTWGGGVFTYGTFAMSGGTISGNTAVRKDGNGGGGGWVDVGDDGTFIMSDGTISDNAGAWGGGVVTFGTFSMSGGTINGNTAVLKDGNGGSGGGVDVGDDGTFIMSGGTISGNAGTWGGGVLTFGTFSMSGGTLSGNKADTNGGGVHANTGKGGSFVKKGGTIDGTNTAPTGRAVFVWDSDSSFKVRNSATGPGMNLDSRVSGSTGGWE